MGDLVIDRAESYDEVPSRIDTSVNEFQWVEEDRELAHGREEETIPTQIEEGPILRKRNGNSRKMEGPPHTHTGSKE